MQISVQLYSVRDLFAEDPDAALRRLAEMGFRHVEPYGLLEHAETLRTLLPAHGLTAPSTHASLLGADDPARVLATAAGLGVRTVIDPYWDREQWDREEDIRATADRLNALAPLASEHGVRIGYHNHDAEARPHEDGRCGLEILAEHLDPRVVLELDTFWAAVGGTDPAHLLTSLGSRIQLAHLKDGPLTGDVRDQVPLGEGEMDVPAVLAAGEQLELGVIEFDNHSGDLFTAIGRSFDLLTTHLQEYTA